MSSRSIRPISGFVGSATLGQAIVEAVDWASIAPSQKSAIVQVGGSLKWIADLNVPTSAQNFDAVSQPVSAVWASDSSRVVILTQDSQLIWLGTPSASSSVPPTNEAKWNLGLLGGSTVSTEEPDWFLLAADSKADQVLLRSRTARGWRLWLSSKAISPAQLSLAGHPVAAVFSAVTATAFVADDASRQVYQIQGLSGTPSFTPVVLPEVYKDSPAGIVLSDDDARLFFVSRRQPVIRILSPSGGTAVSELAMDGTACSVTPMASGRFLLDQCDRSAQPIFFLDTPNPSRVSFVPRGQ